MNKKTLVIYHGNCADGFTAAWVVRNALGESSCEFFPGMYGQPAPDCKGRDVVIVDFSYKRDVMLEIIGDASSVVILDHHKSAEEDLDGVFDYMHVTGKFDMTKSGAMLAWLWFFGDQKDNDDETKAPAIVRTVQDRDLWKFELPGTREFQAVIFSFHYTFVNWDFIAFNLENAETAQGLFEQGEAIERKHHKDVAELVEKCERFLIIGGHLVPVASLPYTLVSDAAHLMAERHPDKPFAACYWDTPQGRVFGLRSLENGADVSKIAEMYNGGGHKHAAGFTISIVEAAAMEVINNRLDDLKTESA